MRESLTAKDISDWLKVAAILVTIGLFAGHIETRMSEQEKSIMQIGQQSERMERYLSSKDANYWQIVKQQGEGENQ